MSRQVKDVSKFRVNGISIRLRISENDPVAQGVQKALEEIKCFPGSISQVTVLPDRVKAKRQKGEDLYVVGRTTGCGSTSSIKIFGGSLWETSSSLGEVREEARKTALHEAGHAELNRRAAHGLWPDGELSLGESEEFARRYSYNPDSCLPSAW